MVRVIALVVGLFGLVVGSEAQYRISGSVKDGAGYEVVLVTRTGAGKSSGILQQRGTFRISGVRKADLQGASLHLIGDDGRYFGPLVLERRSASRVATSFATRITGTRGVIALGRLTLNDDGYASLTAKARGKIASVVGKPNVFAVAGKPIGAGELGIAESPAAGSIRVRADAATGGRDSDRDGIPNALDLDDDGDLNLDASDSDSEGGDVPYSSLVGDFRKTINQHVRDGLNDSVIDATIGGENVFAVTTFVSLPQDQQAEVTDGYVVCNDNLFYCRRNNPTAFFGGVSESSPDFKFKFWSELLNADGYPRLEPISLTGGNVMVASIQPRVGRDQIRAGDVIRTVLTNSDGEEVGSRTFTLAPYFVSVPAIRNYDAGFGSVTVDYSAVSPTTGTIPGVSPSNPIVLSPDGLLTVTFWRPQRQALRSDESGYLDWGNLKYGILIDNLQATCGGLYSGLSSELEEVPGFLGQGGSVFLNQGANGEPLRDTAGDRPALNTNTLSFTVDMSECVLRAGDSPGTFAVTLTAAGESVTGGRTTSSQAINVTIP